MQSCSATQHYFPAYSAHISEKNTRPDRCSFGLIAANVIVWRVLRDPCFIFVTSLIYSQTVFTFRSSFLIATHDQLRAIQFRKLRDILRLLYLLSLLLPASHFLD